MKRTIEQCHKVLELVGGGQEQCNQPTLRQSQLCWEHQPTADGQPQDSNWTTEQIESARVCNGIDLTASK
jgi:hypothetical protein